jgi:uncharacterized membrane protein
MHHAATEFVVIGFPDTRIDPSLAVALREQVERETIKIIDLLFLRKDRDGTVRSMELDEVMADQDYSGFGGVAQSIDGLIAGSDVLEIAQDLAPGTSALIVLFEHVWLRDLRAGIEASGGRVLLAERIPGEVVDAVEEAASAP